MYNSYMPRPSQKSPPRRARRSDPTQVTTAAARAGFADIVNRAAYGKERIVLTRRGRRIAAVVPFEDVAALERIEDAIDLREAKKALAEYARVGKAVTLEELKRKYRL